MEHRYIGILKFVSDGRSVYPYLEIGEFQGQTLDTSFLKLFFGENKKVLVIIDAEMKIISIQELGGES